MPTDNTAQIPKRGIFSFSSRKAGSMSNTMEPPSKLADDRAAKKNSFD